MTVVLSRRRLNRATLARQLLLERHDLTVMNALQQLGGMQSQAPRAPYVGLWSRVQDFDPAVLAELTDTRAVVRLPLMRNTVHLVTGADALAWRGLFSDLHRRAFASHFHLGLGAAEAEVLAEASALLSEAPMTRQQLGRRLATSWPGADPATLAYLATHCLPVCQVPPRGLWATTGPAAWALLETWLGGRISTTPVEALVLRYLGAFGPATVADVQAWSGLTRLAEVVAPLPLTRFRGEDGQMLLDIVGAPLPEEDAPAPPRFLPEYDNLLLAHQDRSRINPDGRPVPLPPGNGATSGTVLIGGEWQANWRFHHHQVEVAAFRPLSDRERDDVEVEARRLGHFLTGGRTPNSASIREPVITAD